MSFRHGIVPNRGVTVVFVCVAAMTFASVPARAGFLDQLFGGASQPTYHEPLEPSQPMPQDPRSFGPSEAPPVPKKVVREAAPVRQKTTDLMRDKTLHVGDAVMMKDGMHVYNGPESGRHTARQFVPVDDARGVSSFQRAALVAVDATRHGVIGRDSAMLASGRSASVGVPVTKGFRITDARGASIRYVGP